MFKVSDIYTAAPKSSALTPVEEKVFEIFKCKNILYQRVETDEAISMEDCKEINKVLDVDMVKTLFLCNRQKTSFFLLVTTADKQIEAKALSSKLGVSRLSFAPEELMEQYLGVKRGAATILGAVIDDDDYIQIVVDQEVAQLPWYGCSTGRTTSYIKLSTNDILNVFLPSIRHKAKIIAL